MLHTEAPQRIRLTQEGYEHYTGQMGITFFEDGLSTDVVPFKDANRMAAVLKCEFEDGTSCNAAQRLLDTAQQEASVERVTEDEVKTDAAPVVAAPVETPVVINLTPAERPRDEANTHSFSRADLEEIADQSGIAGLREIATPLGLKSNSISGLIDELVKVSTAAAQ